MDFDKTIFRFFDYIRVFTKKVLTKLGLRDKQSCGVCGRNQKIVWSVKDCFWNSLPEKWKNRCLCLECFIELYPHKLQLKDFDFIEFPRSN